MPPIVSFIGYHDSGKTTLASQVVAHLKRRGYRLAVIKSTKETGLEFDEPDTDTHIHRQAGADAVTLVAPDQVVMFADPSPLELVDLAERFYPDMDIVIAEGFKDARDIAKIEVCSGSGPRLLNRVQGVIAQVDDISGNREVRVFDRNRSSQIADFIEKRFLQDGPEIRAVDGM